jgi:hypothetical protein
VNLQRGRRGSKRSSPLSPVYFGGKETISQISVS